MKTPDFDKLFQTYLHEWYSAHEGDFLSPDAAEDALPGVYDAFLHEPLKIIGGISPFDYYKKMSADELIAELTSAKNPSQPLLERITAQKECEKALRDIIKGGYGYELKSLCVQILTEKGAEHDFKDYAAFLADEKSPLDFCDIISDIMSQNADAAAPHLFGLIEKVPHMRRIIIAEILSNAKADPRTKTLLENLLTEAEKERTLLPIVAALIGRYGDETLAARLYKPLDSCNYFEYIEIKNAIERLGGIVDDTRDFSSDEYYRLLKNLG